MAIPEFTNPLVYAQFSMRGGWKNTLVVAISYGVLISGAIAALAENSFSPVTALTGWATGLLAIQVLTLLVYGSNRVNAAVRADLKSGLMESHRLMPAPPFSIVAGYIVGAPVQALFMAGVTFVVGAVVCSAAHLEVQRWVVANFMLLAFSLMLWTLTMQMSMTAKGGVPMTFFSIFIGIYTTGFGTVLPAVSVLLCPLIARSVFTMRDSFADLSFAYSCALAGQAMVTILCFLAAVRKYRRPEAPGYNLPLGLAVLALAVGLSLVGMLHDDEFRLSYTRTALSTELIASTVLCLTASLIPLAATARRQAQHRRDPEAFTGARPRLPVLLAVVVCTAIISALFVIGPRVTVDGPVVLSSYPTTGPASSVNPHVRPLNVSPIFAQPQPVHLDQVPFRVQLSIAEVLLALTGVAAVFRWVYLATDKAWLVVTIWIVLFWIVPLVADTLHRSVQDRSNDPMGPIASLSPIGTLIITWTGEPGVARLGVPFAAAIILLPAILIVTTQRRQRNTRRAAALTSAAV